MRVDMSRFRTVRILDKRSVPSGDEYKCEFELACWAVALVQKARMGRVCIRRHENGLVREGCLKTLRQAEKRKLSTVSMPSGQSFAFFSKGCLLSFQELVAILPRSYTIVVKSHLTSGIFQLRLHQPTVRKKICLRHCVASNQSPVGDLVKKKARSQACSTRRH